MFTTLIAVAIFGCCAYVYGSAMATIMVTQRAATPIVRPPRPPGEDRSVEPAFELYFAGQAVADLRLVWTSAYAHVRALGQQAVDYYKRTFFRPWHGLWRRGSGVVLGISLVGGVITGAFVALTLPLAHAVAVLLAYLGALITIAVLRVLDAGRLLIRRISMSCPSCHEPVAYPDYACPGDGCGHRHRKIRPGRYGLFRRVCMCGARLPTLLLLGSGSMASFCPRCEHPLTEFSGSAVEVVLPVIGATAAGKTQLMLTLVAAIGELAQSRGLEMVLADDQTRQRYEDQRAALERNQPTRPTTTALPRSYAVHVGRRDAPDRLIHVLDAAGERFYSTGTFQELRLVSRATAIVFVVDVMATEQFRRILQPWEESDLPRLPSTVASPDLVVQQAVDNMEQMGVDTRRCRAAVVLAKRDVFGRYAVTHDVPDGKVSLENWLDERLGFGPMIRTLRQSFRTVDYFATEANIGADGCVHDSVVDVAHWFAQHALPSLAVDDPVVS